MAARDLLAAEIDGTGATAIQEHDQLTWRVFYQTPAARDAAREALAPFARTHGLTTASSEVEDEDWARRSQEQLTAVRVGGIIVTPPWDLPRRPGIGGQGPETAGLRPIVIEIEPSVGFGTGHHASTRLCLLAMQQLDLTGRSVIDVGTGSGILAIAAVKLGAARVTAIDVDADAVGCARENAARNRAAIDLRVVDVLSLESGAFDVVLANLTAAWLRRLSDRLQSLTPGGGALVLSGLQTSEKTDVLEAFLPSCRAERELDEEGWTALILSPAHLLD